MTRLISGQVLSTKGYPAVVFGLPISLSLVPIITEILSMAGYYQGLRRRSKQNPHQPMIPYFPYNTSCSPIDLRYGTLSNCWNSTQSLPERPCAIQPGVSMRRRELALLKAEPGKNWNSFETFIFVTLKGSIYKINQDPGREKSGRHFLKRFSRWPTPKIDKIKNKHNFGIINPMKLILVPNSMFLSMIYSPVYLKMHSEFTWP